jgi:hypothetical protein
MASLLEHRRAWRPTREQWGLGALLVVALVVRWLAITGLGHNGDLFALSQWAEGMAAYGLGGYYAAGGTANYPPLLYLLWPLGLTFDGNDLRSAIRALSIPFDLALGAVLFVVARDAVGGRASRIQAERVGLLGAGLYLLNPAVIASGPLWGQVDGIGALPMVVAIAAIARGRIATATVLAVLAGLIKPQFGIAAFVIAVVLVLELRSRGGLGRLIRAAVAAIATFGAVLLPLGLTPGSYIGLITLSTDRYRYYSLYGFNPWAIAFGFGEHDDTPAFYAAAALTALAIGVALALLWRRRDLVALLAVGSLVGLALYFLPTRVHERYLFGAVALMAPLAALHRPLRWAFVALSLLFFLTVLYVLGNAPPRMTVPLPSWAVDPIPTWEVSLAAGLMTLVGAWCAWRLLRLVQPSAGAEPRAEPG